MMRHIWGLLFWFADGGWSFRNTNSHNMISQPLNPLEALAVREHLASLAANGTSLASPLLGYPTTRPIMWDTLTKLYELVVTHRFNMTMPDPSIMGILMSIYNSMGLQEYGLPSNISNRTNGAMLLEPYPFEEASAAKYPSLLSNVHFLKTLTSNRWVNNLIITCLEGQIITIVVVICFILIFLIREWVVQQQPGINMGAGFNAEFANGDRALREHDPDLHDAEHGDIAAIDRIIRDVEVLQGVMDRRAEDVGERPADRPRRRMVRFEDNRVDGAGAGAQVANNNNEDVADSTSNPPRVNDDVILAEPPTSIDHLDASEFISLWRRADGDAEEILRLMEEEGLGERLRYWKNALQALQQSNAASGSAGSRRIITNGNLVSSHAESEGNRDTDSSSPAKDGPQSRPEKTRLMSVGPVQQKQLIGEAIYPKIKIVVPELAGKITGMLLEMDNFELLDLVDDDAALHSKMDEALIVYNTYLINNDDNPVLTNEDGKDQLLEGLIIRKAKAMHLDKPDKLAEMLLEMDIDDLLNLIENDLAFHTKAEEMLTLYELHLTQMRKVFATKKGKEKFLAENPNFKMPKIPGSSATKSNDSSVIDPHSNGSSSRPRSVSDGAQIGETVSPLARDYWSFDGLSNAQPANMDEATQPGGEGDFPSTSAAIEEPPTSTGPDNGHGSAEDDHLRGQFGLAASHDDKNMSDRSDMPALQSESGVADNLDERTATEEVPGNNPFHPDDILPLENPAPQILLGNEQQQNAPGGYLGYIVDWLWGDMNVAMEGQGGDDEHIVQDIDAEEPFVPVGDRHGAFAEAFEDEPEVDDPRDMVAAALADEADPNDPDALDDAEDFDGIMELIGMRGPLTGLIQNALFGAVLISLTVAFGVWLPYSVGKLTLLLVANPMPTVKLPLKLVFKAAAVIQDITLVLLGGISYAIIRALSLLMFVFSKESDPIPVSTSDGAGLALDSLKFAYSAGERITAGFISTLAQIPDSEIPAFSAASHEALLYIKSLLSTTVGFITTCGLFQTVSPATEAANLLAFDFSRLHEIASIVGSSIIAWLSSLPSTLAKPETWVISLDGPVRSEPVDLALSYWNGTDRLWAIITGYLTFVFVGAAYIRKGSPFSSTQTGRDWEAMVIDVLNQAGGVMKVILIISIEMLVFPLYCGLLLDLATLPLFEKASLMSRMNFAVQSPSTSIFVHWFVGTCYMFHFALFVSMCRKILRTGVLYFIRDPDDPTFHPVRDVLERNVATQLRKITFSAMVYGALVLVCLGGVVWSLSFAFRGVLPITWSSNEPVLEFPVDLLFYNFLMPVAVRYFRPSDGLQTMYSWWFRKCARLLRLTWFLLDERMNDEEGNFVQWNLKDLWIRMQDNDLLASEPLPEGQFIKNGRYVRTPASDMVRLPKEGTVFLEVSDRNERIDNKPDREEGLHGKNSKLFKMVYAPPWFRTRIFAFVVLLWLFAAVTGCSITLIPLVFGRCVFDAVLPGEVKKNDIYAFSMGINILGGLVYCLLHLQSGAVRMRRSYGVDAETPAKIMRKLSAIGLRAVRLIYAYSAFVFVLPALLALLVEFYVMIPLHTYFLPGDEHTIQFVQTWTLGLLFLNLARRCILWYADTRPAEALRAIVRNGMLDPDIRIATRCFIFPITVCSVVALALPLGYAWFANHLELFGTRPEVQMLVYRYSFPAATAIVLKLSGLAMMAGIVKEWRMSIRDEVYLIGERLHNFGDSRRKNNAVAIPRMGRIEA